MPLENDRRLKATASSQRLESTVEFHEDSRGIPKTLHVHFITQLGTSWCEAGVDQAGEAPTMSVKQSDRIPIANHYQADTDCSMAYGLLCDDEVAGCPALEGTVQPKTARKWM